MAADCTNLAVKQSFERRQPLWFDNENFDDKKTGKLESLWTQAQDFDYLKITRIKIHKLYAFGVVEVKRNEMNAIQGDAK